MRQLSFLKSLISKLVKEQPTLSREQAILHLLNSNYNYLFKDISVGGMAYLLNIAKRDVNQILRNLIGNNNIKYTNSQGVTVITSRNKPGLIKKHRDKCENLLLTYQRYIGFLSQQQQ